jgi:hypothetical protein
LLISIAIDVFKKKILTAKFAKKGREGREGKQKPEPQRTQRCRGGRGEVLEAGSDGWK